MSRAQKNKNKASVSALNQVRIIGGNWRGRRLSFPSLPGLRPTPDRVRETLFNWLAPYIAGAHCLDLFAGSGAIGFEALSRGAESVLMLEKALPAVKQIKLNLERLSVTNALIYQSSAPEGMAALPVPKRPFDIVFLDPPFREQWIARCCQWLEDNDWLAKDALIYIEAERELQPLPIPVHWRVLREKIAGQVNYSLVSRG